MPTRPIREGINASGKVNQLSSGAELFYRRLLLIVDDEGRFEANPAVIRVKTYPLKLSCVTEKHITDWLAQCVDARLVLIYHNGQCLQVTNFRQTVRTKSKLPKPTAIELNSVCSTTVLHEVQLYYKPFKKPGLEEVKLLFAKAGLPSIEAEKFMDHYESNGWKVGKVPMRSLGGAVGTWSKNYRAGTFAAKHGSPAKSGSDKTLAHMNKELDLALDRAKKL